MKGADVIIAFGLRGALLLVVVRFAAEVTARCDPKLQ